MLNNDDPLAHLWATDSQNPIVTSDTDPLAHLWITEPPSSKKEITLGNKTAALAKGAASGFGGSSLDTAALIYNLPAMLHNLQVQLTQGMTPEQLSQAGLGEYAMAQEVPMIPSATEAIEKGIDVVTGGYTETPEELKHLYEGVKFAGSLGGLGGAAKGAGKLGAKGLETFANKLGTTIPTELAGAVATGTAMNKLGEEYGPLAGLVGGAATGAVTTKGLQGLKDILTGKSSSLGEMTIGKAISLMGEPVQAVEHLAKKYNLDLPFNIRIQGPTANFMANIGMSSIFRAKKYNDLLEKAPKQLVDNITKKIDTIHPENLGSKEVSQQYKEFLQKEQEKVQSEYGELYDKARSYLKPNEKISMNHTVSALKDLKDMLSAPSPSAPQKFVMRKVNELADHLGILQKVSAPRGFTQEQWMESPQLYQKVIEQLEKNPQVSAKLHDMIQQRKAFLFDTDYGEIRGTKALLGRLTSALNKDISNSSNKEFIENWKAANSFYKMEAANRVRSDLANSLTEGTFPTQAYDFMTTPARIDELKKIIGTSSKGAALFNSLKRAKLNDVLIDKIIDKDGNIRHANFVSTFSKGNKQQDLLKTLLGKENYNELSELTELSKAFSKASQQFQNFSGTTKTYQDLFKIASLGKGLFDIATGGGTTLFLSGIGSTAAPYIASHLLSNPRYINAAVKFGEAIKNKNISGVSHYDNTMKNIFFDTMKKQAPQLLNKQIPRNQEVKK